MLASYHAGAPVLRGGPAGVLTALLEAALVTGFNSVAVSQIEVLSGEATVTTATTHGLTDFAYLGYLPLVEIAGSGVTGIDGRVRVSQINTTTSFNFYCPGVANGQITGTITVKRAGAGWTKVYDNSAGKMAFRNNAIDGSGGYAYVQDDLDATYATATRAILEAYTTFDGNSTFDGLVGGSYRWVHKSQTTDETAREWYVFADDRTFYFFSKPNQSSYPNSWSNQIALGDIVPFAPQEKTLVYSGPNNNSESGISGSVSGFLRSNGSTSDHTYLAKNADGTVTNRLTRKNNPGLGGIYHSGGTCPYPLPGNANYIVGPTLLIDTVDSVFRGVMPGMFCSAHANSFLSNGTMVGVNIGGTQRTLGAFTQVSYNQTPTVMIDMYGPWQ